MITWAHKMGIEDYGIWRKDFRKDNQRPSTWLHCRNDYWNHYGSSNSAMKTSIEEIYTNLRKLFNIQFHEFYRQYKEKTLNPEMLVNDDSYEKGQKFLLDIIDKAESIGDDFSIKEQLDISCAEFCLAFLMKIDEEYPGEEDDNEEG